MQIKKLYLNIIKIYKIYNSGIFMLKKLFILDSIIIIIFCQRLYFLNLIGEQIPKLKY